MDQVGSSMKISKDLRQCFFCSRNEIETAHHFVSVCPYYAALRDSCLLRVQSCIRDCKTNLHAILQAQAPEQLTNLFLGSELLSDLSVDRSMQVENVVLDYLKVIWRKRRNIWKQLCVPRNEWALKR